MQEESAEGRQPECSAGRNHRLFAGATGISRPLPEHVRLSGSECERVLVLFKESLRSGADRQLARSVGLPEFPSTQSTSRCRGRLPTTSRFVCRPWSLRQREILRTFQWLHLQRPLRSTCYPGQEPPCFPSATPDRRLQPPTRDSIRVACRSLHRSTGRSVEPFNSVAGCLRSP